MDKLVKKVGVLTLMVTGLLVSQPVIQVTQAQEVNEFQQVFTGERDIDGVVNAVLTQSSKINELGMYPSVLIAQGLFESGFGRSLYAVESNNLYGLKEGSGVAKYSTPGEGVSAYLDLLTNGYYSQYSIGGQLTPDDQIDALVKAGWSPVGKEYGVKLKNIIEYYDLTQYDN